MKPPLPIVPDVRDRMARGARETSLRFRRVDLVLIGVSKRPLKNTAVVTAGAPLARLRAGHRPYLIDLR